MMDSYPTETSALQARTEVTLLEHFPDDAKPYPLLHKSTHIQFLARNLLQGFTTKYTSQDASQPWLVYWSLHSLSLLQVDLDPDNKQRYMQHPDFSHY
jgi:protein farnesyltransferase subunit beta